MSAETLRKAAHILRERGWTQGRYEGEDGCLCIDGALILAHFGRPLWREGGFTTSFAFVRDDERAVEEVVGAPELITTWNDAPERTADEVIAALEAAAARLEAS